MGDTSGRREVRRALRRRVSRIQAVYVALVWNMLSLGYDLEGRGKGRRLCEKGK